MVNVIIEEPAFTIRITGGIGAQGSKGDPGNGIASAVLNDDYTLTLNFTDGTSYTTEPIRGAQGETGNGIASAVLNPDYTLTLYFTDGTHYTTTSIRGAQGEKGEKGDKGDQGIPGQRGEQGERGEQGVKGDPGFSPIATVTKSGTVTTLTVTDEDGTTTAEILDGAPGAKGDTGAQGAKGDKGDTGATGATGNGIASAVLNQDYTLTLTYTNGQTYTTPSIRGAQGEKGDTGEVASLNSIAPDYSQSSTYAIGDYCIHNDLLYVCLTTISTAEVWTASHWMQVDVTSVMSDLTASLNKIIIKDGLKLTRSNLSTGKYYKVDNGVVSEASEGSAQYCAKIDVSALIGQHMYVKMNTIRGGSIRCFGFCDSSNNVGSYFKETNMQKVADGSYIQILIVDKPFMFFSCSSNPTDITIVIQSDYLFSEKADIAFRLDTKKYYHVSFDDVILCLQDITTNADTYESAFENDFLGWCKQMHDLYGTTFSMYVFYADNASNPTWTLEDCTDNFADEFTANSDWLKFGFHAYAQGSTATSREATMATDYSNTITQLVRITGSVNCIDRMPRLQSYIGTLTALKAIRDCDLGCVGFLASANNSDGTPRDSYYFDADQNAYIDKHIYMYDAENHLHFVKTTYVWGSANINVGAENSIQWFNANKFVEIFTHENGLTSGTKSSMQGKFIVLTYSHRPTFMMNEVLTS